MTHFHHEIPIAPFAADAQGKLPPEVSASSPAQSVPPVLQTVRHGHDRPETESFSAARDRALIVRLSDRDDEPQLQRVVKAAYRQVFDRDLDPYALKLEFTALEDQLRSGQLSVRGFIKALGLSELYIREFYTPYPNTKVIELGTQHFLGRAPVHQTEMRRYNQILATSGIRHFVQAIVASAEYHQVFGDDVVPYRRFSSFPASGFGFTQPFAESFAEPFAESLEPPIRDRPD